MSEEVKYGEIKCQGILKSGKNAGNNCKNGAYYKCDNLYLCGIHSKKYTEPITLQKFSTTEKTLIANTKYSDMLESAKIVAEKNKINNITGKVTLVRMSGRFSKVEPMEGWLDIYPNFKSTYQGIGLILPGLSPMSLGPIKHGQPGIPESKTLENFHQFSKYYSKLETMEEFKKSQIAGFNDLIPHRHKFKGQIPDYFVWIDKDGEEYYLGYLESRQFYCNFYEKLVEESKDFLKLKNLLKDGYNLRICGPDAYNLYDDILESYKDISVPRGHEFCLYTMLTCKEYPWIEMKTFDF